jgi:hypothetical protein
VEKEIYSRQGLFEISKAGFLKADYLCFLTISTALKNI